MLSEVGQVDRLVVILSDTFASCHDLSDQARFSRPCYDYEYRYIIEEPLLSWHLEINLYG